MLLCVILTFSISLFFLPYSAVFYFEVVIDSSLLVRAPQSDSEGSRVSNLWFCNESHMGRNRTICRISRMHRQFLK